MSAARAGILFRVRSALADVPPGEHDHHRATPPAVPAGDPVELFCTVAGHYRAAVTRVGPADKVTVTAAIRAIAERHSATRFAVPDGFQAGWLPAEINALREPVDQLDLDRVDGVVSTCALAIADTGTIVLDGGAGQGARALTLLPDLHVCVVEADRVVATFEQGIERISHAPGRPYTFVSGPSATSDIELDRVEGVHGPRRLEVVIAQP